MKDPLIQEGEVVPLQEATEDFIKAGRHLLALQEEVEPFVCQVLASVRVDPDLDRLVSQYNDGTRYTAL